MAVIAKARYRSSVMVALRQLEAEEAKKQRAAQRQAAKGDKAKPTAKKKAPKK